MDVWNSETWARSAGWLKSVEKFSKISVIEYWVFESSVFAAIV